MILTPRPKFYEHGSHTAGCRAIRGALCSFVFWVFFCGCRHSDELVLLPQCRNIGEISTEDAGLITIPFFIQNRTDSEITIREGSVPCVCTKLEIGPAIISPWSTREIKMHVNSSLLSGTRTITAEVITNHPNFPVLEPKVVGFFGLPKVHADYGVDLGVKYAGASIDELVRLPLEEGLVPTQCEMDEFPEEKLHFSLIIKDGIAFLRVVGELPQDGRGFRWTGNLKFSVKSKPATLKVNATIVPYFDSPKELHFAPTDFGVSPTVNFTIRRNSVDSVVIGQNDLYEVDWDLGDKLHEIQVKQVGSELRFRVIGQANLPVGTFSEGITIRINNGAQGRFAFSMQAYGRVLDTKSVSR